MIVKKYNIHIYLFIYPFAPHFVVFAKSHFGRNQIIWTTDQWSR